ncbi:ABC transporter permease [Anaerocolumna sp. MB42-C2]|uniref:ABC transporter permease n=1 Tax=Anaerocolumna sp. MB42-C2 TaxID=3070997 RepID=UPI0027E0D594|nr:ABC transporter permease [Anaerocolumna sp. MB42-C2]WMJ87907.1 ABC transporter permease [Anaerocolumna sp. MB42-C2]
MKNNLYTLRIKAILNDKLTCGILMISLLLFLYIINNFSIHAEERSSIPIGILNLDQSESSKDLIMDLRKVPSFYVYEGSKEYLNGLLLKEQIRAYLIIHKEYEKSIQIGKTEDLITMYYSAGDETAKILSDIIAGEMLYKICLYKGYNKYQFLPWKDYSSQLTLKQNKMLTWNDYNAYANSLMNSPDFDFGFNISMINTDNRNNGSKIDNSILYQQVIWGIIAMLLGFTAMLMSLGAVLEIESGIRNKAGISLLGPFSLDLSYFTAAFTLQSIFCIVLLASLAGKFGNLTIKQVLLLFLLLELFSGVMILWFLLIGKLSERAGRFQLISIICILLFGLLGFLSITAGFLGNELLNISKIIPNSWFIDEFTAIILNKNLQGITNISYIKFIITACGLLIINRLLSKKQY